MTVKNKNFFERLGYENVSQLKDGTWTGTEKLLFTTGLYIGLTTYGWEKRYCYENKSEAIKELKLIKTFSDIPNGWVAKRVKQEKELD